MRMQEPESWESLESPSGPRQQWQSNQENQEYGGYRHYTQQFEPEKGQKIHPQERLSGIAKALAILAVIQYPFGLSAAVVGVITSSIILSKAGEQSSLLACGIVGLVSTIVFLAVTLPIFILGVTVLKKMRQSHMYYNANKKRG
jgi:hypothetical protein